jgi:hypothetical protein
MIKPNGLIIKKFLRRMLFEVSKKHIGDCRLTGRFCDLRQYTIENLPPEGNCEKAIKRTRMFVS